jgi:superfamily II DNA or RNA helicase
MWGLSATPWSREEDRNELLRDTFKEFFVIDRARVEASGHLTRGKVFLHALDREGEFDEAIEKLTAEEAHRRVKRFPVMYDVPEVMHALARVKGLVNALRALRGNNFVAAASRGLVDPAKEDDATRDLLQKIRAADEARRRRVFEEHAKRARWQYTLEALQTNERRNQKVADLVSEEVARGESVLVLVASIEHGERLAAALPGAALVYSKLPMKTRRQRIEAFRTGELRVLVSTSLADEGLDVPRASRLVLVCGGRAAGKLEQRVGRILRVFEGKEYGIVHDFLDEGMELGRAQARARMRVYERLGYEPEIVRHENFSDFRHPTATMVAD